MQYYFTHKIIKQYTSKTIRPLLNLDGEQLHILVDNILEGFVWLSTTIDHYSEAETLTLYCKQIKDERYSKNIICDYYRLVDKYFYSYRNVTNIDVVEVYKIAPNYFKQM